jgi:signal peptidase I
MMSASTAIAPARISPEHAAPYLPSTRVNPIAAKVRANGSACFRVLGASMFPWIRSGDFVFVRRSAFERTTVGQVILFERDQRLFVHRVLARSQNKSGNGSCSLLITKGDALDGKDAPVSESEFLGRVTRVHRGRRHIDLEFMGRILLGKILAFFSPASFLLYSPLRIVKHNIFS